MSILTNFEFNIFFRMLPWALFITGYVALQIQILRILHLHSAQMS